MPLPKPKNNENQNNLFNVVWPTLMCKRKVKTTQKLAICCAQMAKKLRFKTPSNSSLKIQDEVVYARTKRTTKNVAMARYKRKE